MNKAYQRINWKDYPSKETAVNAVNLNKVDAGLNEIDNRIVLMDSGKADTETVLGLVKDVSMDSPTGIFTITYQNGTSKTFDTKLEKIAVNFEFDKVTQKIVITLDSGEKQYIDLSSFVKPITFTDSADIAFSEVDNNVTATIMNGSVSVAKLAPEVITTLTETTEEAAQSAISAKNDAETAADNASESATIAQTSASNANTSETNAANSATDAEAWAVGQRNGVNVPESDITFENSAKYWASQAKSSIVVVPTTTRTDITEQGAFSIDATMANPNVAGSFAENISGLHTDIANLQKTKIVILHDVTFTRSAFVLDETYDAFPYKGTASVPQIDDASYVPSVTFSIDDAISGNFAPIAECDNGSISIYAKEMPDDIRVIVPSVVCAKVVE